MADHGELLAEMACVGRLSGPERVKHAQKRRAEQLKVWAEMEKDGAGVARSNGGGEKSKRVTFPTSVTLLEAAARNDLQEVRQLLGSGVDPDLYNEDGLTALHQSCIDDFVELAVCLLGAGASVNAVDSELWTPLHAAATCGHLELVQLLLDSGADLLAVNADRNMPFDLCEDQATLELLETLMAEQGVTQERIEECRAAAELEMLRELRGGADLTLRDQQGAGLLHVAAAHGFLRVAELLLERGMSPDQPDADGWTPLHAAVCWAKIQMVELLVAHGASLNARSELDETPLDVCTDEEVRTKLLELKHKHESIMRSQERHKNPLQRRVSSAGSRGKVVRRSSVLERSSLHRREQQKEARVWQERGREAELLDEDEDGQTDAELKMHTAAVIGGDDAASGAEPPLAVLGNGDTPTEPVPGDALSRERSQHTLADLKRQRAASKLLKPPAPPTPEPRPPAPPLQDVYFTPASGDPPLLKLRAPEEDVTSTKEPCCRLM